MEQGLLAEVWRQYQALYEHLFQSQSYCDGTLIVGRYGRKKILVHKAILASHSDYFRSLFYGVHDVPSMKVTGTKDIDDMSDDLCTLLSKGGSSSGKDEVTIDIEDYQTVADVLKFVYCGKISLTRANLIGVKAVADLFQLPLLQELCIKYLERSLSPENVCKWHREAEQANSFTIALTCYEYLRRNVLPVTWAKAWPDATAETLKKLLQDDETAASEIELFRGLLQWAEARLKEKGQASTPDSLRTTIGDMASLVRLPQMTPEDIANVVRPTGLFTEDDISKALMSKFSNTPVYPADSLLTRKRKDTRPGNSGYVEFESPSRRSRFSPSTPHAAALGMGLSSPANGVPGYRPSPDPADEADAELAMLRAVEAESLAEHRRLMKAQRRQGRAELMGLPASRMADDDDEDEDEDEDEDDEGSANSLMLPAGAAEGASNPAGFASFLPKADSSLLSPAAVVKPEPDTSESGEAAEYAQDLDDI